MFTPAKTLWSACFVQTKNRLHFSNFGAVHIRTVLFASELFCKHVSVCDDQCAHWTEMTRAAHRAQTRPDMKENMKLLCAAFLLCISVFVLLLEL